MTLQDLLGQKRRSRAHALDAAHRGEADFIAADPEVAAAHAALRAAQLAHLRGKGDSAKAQADFDALLARKGLTWPTPVFDCPVCQDQSYVDGRLCACVRQARVQDGLDPNARFEAFDEGLFPGEDLARRRKLTARLEKYAAAFPSPPGTLLLQGPGGTGKTFLAHCTAHAVAARGFTVAVVTAFDYLQSQRYDNWERGKLLHECDLLVLDDLGTEPQQRGSSEALVAMASSRLAGGRGLIVTTNLHPTELQERYSERLFSRLSDTRCALMMRVAGRDLRLR